MKEYYYGCFSNGRCAWYGVIEYDSDGRFIRGNKSLLNALVNLNGALVARWKVKPKL